jgi:hypothetical protein
MTDLKHRNLIHRPHHLVREIENLRQEIARSKQVLALPTPDTFLGRSLREEIPLREEGEYLKRADFTPDHAHPLHPPATESDRAALPDLLGVLVQAAVEQANGRARAAFYLANRQATTLHHIAGMTKEYARYVDGFAISPGSLACGLAAATRCAVITPDVIQDQRWHQWRWLANKFGYRACWSFPIETTNGKILGTFAIYYQEPTDAKPPDLELASVLTRTAAKIMSKTLTE